MLSDDTLLLLNRATLTVHTVRTAVHELNNILQMVSGYAELLQAAPDLTPTTAKRAEAILRQTARGQAILQTVTELTRTGDAGAARADASRVLEAVLQSRRYEHQRAGIAVTVDAPEGAVRVAAPARHLEQMLLNLVINAEQAVVGTSAPSLIIRLERGPDTVDVSVADTGPGVHGPFDPFAPFATGRPGIAAGLGLTAVRLLSGLHHGSIEPVAGSGAGTCWRLRLPAAAPPL